MVIFVLALVIMPDMYGKKKRSKSKKKDTYYTQRPLFFPAPSSIGKTWKVPNFGPVGIGIDLVRPGMTMKISKVEKGSPADKTGKLKIGQIIESVNGQVLKDRDPREILGDWITEAEAADGKINLKIKGLGNVLVQIPVLGRYSPTWPENCPKSDKIVRNLADRLAKQKKPAWGSILFLLSTGEEKDLAVVKKWVKEIKNLGPYPWHKGYLGPGLCEYYLRTGDKSVLPVIKTATDELKAYMYNGGGWSGRGKSGFSYGQLNAAGVHCVTFLLMAKYCGVDVDDYMLQNSLRHFFRFAGRGTVPYGDYFPENGYRDNGKTGGLAVAMAAAALLSPDGENSVYAKARDNCAMKSFYATNWFHAAHTGGGIGEIWHNVTMSMMRKKRPIPYRSYLDTRRWVMDLSRRFDGGIGIAGNKDRYDKAVGEDNIAWGNYFALTYTIPRKKLQIYGAPKSLYAKNFKLPVRPWGNKADDVFLSNQPVKSPYITLEDLLNEKVETDSSARIMSKWGKTPSDKIIMKYLCHPDFGIRDAMVGKVTSMGRGDIVLKMLKSDDPRMRFNGILALVGPFKAKNLPDDKVTPEILQQVEKIFDDPNESMYVKIWAIRALQRGGSKMVAKHKNQLLKYLKNDEWWFQYNSFETLTMIATSPEHYKDVIPGLCEVLGRTRISKLLLRKVRDLDKKISKAPENIKSFAVTYFKKAFDNVPNKFVDENTGYTLIGGARYAKKKIAGILVQLPGGAEVGRTDPKATLSFKRSGDEKDMYVFSGKYTPDKKFVGKWVLQAEVAPSEFDAIEKKVASKKKFRANMMKMIEEKTAARLKKAKSKKKKNKLQRKSGPLWRRIRKTYLNLKDNGEIENDKLRFWTDDMLVDNRMGEARKMILHKTKEGNTYLLVEKGGFGEEEIDRSEDDTGDDTDDDGSSADKRVPPDWHCGYEVYERVK